MEDFKSLFNADVDQEDADVYPANICASHRAVFYRYRRAKQGCTDFSTSMTLSSFMPHNDDDCRHCLSSLRSPIGNNTQKPKWTPPGRGKRSKLLIPSESMETENPETNSLLDMYENASSNKKSQLLETFILGLSNENQLQIVDLILKQNSQDITRDVESVQKKYDSISKLNELDIMTYLMERNKTMVTMLLAMTQSTIHEDYYRLSVVLESIYKLRNANFLGPVSLLQNLTFLSMTNSKAAVDIIGSSGAGGKYTTLCRWLGSISSKPPTVPDGDTLFVFDNEQIVGKTWNIKPQNKVRTSIITTVAAVQLDKEMRIENNPLLHPSRWFTQARVADVLHEIVSEESAVYNELRKVHMEQFKLFVNASIEQILEEHVGKDDIIDKLVVKMQQAREFKTCLDCNMLLAKTKRKCPLCKKDLVKCDIPETDGAENPTDSSETISFSVINPEKKTKAHETENLRYDHVESGHPSESVPVYVMDPVFVNPNSFESLKLVLRHIGKTAGVRRYGGTEREWVIVCCDGLPYTMIFRLIQEYLTCAACDKGFLGSELFEQHKKQHSELEEVHYIREFDWVLVHTGDGHYEMNMMKSFVELNWDVFMTLLVNRMGWTSEAAMRAAKLCYDNHKTWQLILVFHFGTLLELLTPYVKKCQHSKDPDTNPEKPTANGFLQFVKSMEEHPNYMYMFQMVSRYSQAIVNMRMGIRRNNSTLIQSAKFMSKGLFHGRTHPRYQQIEMIETLQRKLMPNDLKTFISMHESMSRTDSSKGQGYDFILEEINKGVKSWIRRGVASDSMWLSICRNYDKLLQMRHKVTDMLKIDSEGSYVRKLDLEDAIVDWRVCLREKQYLVRDSIIHYSISGHKIHDGLVNFTKEAERKRNYRLLETFLQQDFPDDLSLKRPVFVTNAEAEHYEAFQNQTIEVIEKTTVDFIETIQDEEKRNTYREKFRKEVLRKNKAVHIEFFNEVLEVVNEAFVTSNDSCEESESN